MPDPPSSGGAPISREPAAAPSPFTYLSMDRMGPSVPARFEGQARLHPERIAVADAGSALTYRDLNRLANRIAHALLSVRDARPEPVALLVGSGGPIVAAMLGVLKAGKFYVALDPSQPLARSTAILEECRPAVLITDAERMAGARALRSALEPPGGPLVSLDALEPGLCEEDPGLSISGETLAYLVYTSGSTGIPKGVMQDHRYVQHLAMVYTNGGRISSEDRLALTYSPSFAGAARDIYCALLNGAALLFYDVKRDGLSGFADWLRRERITVFFAVATMFRHFCRLLTPEDRFPSVRLIELGSETVHAGEVHLFQRHFSEDCRMIVNLGGSEVSPVCQFLVDAGTRIEGATVPAGYPAEDVELILWDAEGKPVAAGAEGEIVVRSPYLSRGYFGRPELSEAAFIPDPDGGDRRLFRSGDLGRLLPDGCLLHLGRRDFQVKIRGYRVETAEVEAVLASSGLVKDVSVTAWLDSTGEENLAAWLVPQRPEAPPSTGELRALVARALPDYMVPGSFIVLDSLPVTDAGKLDRRALPDPREVGQRPEVSHLAPRTAVERSLKDIWSEVLGNERIGLKENFFDLGGHSLLALQVVARIAAAFRVMLPANCLFEYPTLERLAEVVDGARGIEAGEAIGPGARGAEAPMSLAQQRLWILAGLYGSSEAANLVRAFRLEGVLDLGALERALFAISSRHDILRASFLSSGDLPVQVTAPEGARVLSLVDLRHVPESRCQAALDSTLRAAHGRRFDLAKGPLWSVQVIRLAGNRQVLHLAMHHIISDDWSIQVLLRELGALYQGYLAGREETLPGLPVQYADYARWQRRFVAGKRLEKQLNYWKDHLGSAPPLLRLPLDRPRQAGVEFHAGMVRLHLDRELTARLNHLSRESETTLYVTLLAAYAILLSWYGNPEEVVVGTVVANRYPVETEALIGFFVNTLALRLRWQPGATFREVQACAHRAAVNGYAHPDVPFDRVVEALRPDRSALHSPVFQTLLVLQNVPKEEFALSGMVTTPLELGRPSAGATFDLTLTLTEIRGELRGALEFNAALFDQATIEGMAARFEALVAGIVLDPEATAAQPAPPVALAWRRSEKSVPHAPGPPWS